MRPLIAIPASIQALSFFLTLNYLGNGLSVLVNVLPSSLHAGVAGVFVLLPFGIACMMYLGVAYLTAAALTALSTFLIRPRQRTRLSFAHVGGVTLLFGILNCLTFAIADLTMTDPMGLPSNGGIPNGLVYAALSIGALLNGALATLFLRGPDAAT